MMWSSIWFKIAVAINVSTLLVFNIIYFSFLSPGTKYKFYVVQFYILFTSTIFLLTKYYWKCLVTDLLANVKNSNVVLAWKAFLCFYFTLVHCAQFTNLYGYQEPSAFQWLAWIFFGSYSVWTLIFLSARFLFWMFTKTKQHNGGVLTSNRVTIVCVAATLVVTISSYLSAMAGPEFVK